MTHRIYYTEPSCRVFAAVVTRAIVHDGRPAAILDRTAFYPTSGGQPSDRGWLGSTDVVDTVEVDDDIVHVLATSIPEGTTVRGEVDWSRRLDHMQQHTGQHVLSAAFDRLFANKTLSFHMGAEVSTIDLARAASPVEVEQGVDEANRIVWENRTVSIQFASADEAAGLGLRKQPVRQGTLRLIDVSDFDRSACGGTHVASTGAIGLIAVVGAERFRGGVRLTFVCGGRALRSLRGYRDAVAASARVLSVVPHELPVAIERIQAEGRELRKTVGHLQASLAVHAAARLVSEAEEIHGIRLVVETLDGWDPPGLKAVAAGVTTQVQAAVALFSAQSPALVVVARSSGVAVEAHTILRMMIERFGGRGGGKPDLAQGGGLAGDIGEMAAFARAAISASVRNL
jgi:alanyl-tRNA synthetase